MDPSKAAALSRDTTSSLMTLEELAKLDLPFLRENVARHPNVTPKLLLRLVPTSLERDTDRNIAMAVLSNPRTPSAALLAILGLLRSERLDGNHRENWQWEDVALGVLSHQNVPAADAVRAVEFLGLSKSLRVRLAKRYPHKGVMEFLSSDRSESVRRAAASGLSGGPEHGVGPERR